MGGSPGIIYGSAGRIRAFWRILLFAGLFLTLLLGAAVAVQLLGLPAGDAAIIVQGTLTLVAALAAGWLLLWRVEELPAGALGFALGGRAKRQFAAGLALGVGALGLVVLVLAAAGAYAFRPDAGGPWVYIGSLAGSLLLFAAPAAAEEALFRGYPFQVLVEGVGPAVATVLASALFALAHAFNPEVDGFALLNIFLAGVLLSVAYLRTRSLWCATGLHLGWNWGMAGLLDLPVSGLQLVDTPLYDTVAAGPEWITGAAFGPEAGLAGTLAFLLALAAVVRLRVFTADDEILKLRPIVDRRLEPAGGNR